MKKFKFVLSILILIPFVLIGCKSNIKEEPNMDKATTGNFESYTKNETVNDKISKRYEEVKKETLSYEIEFSDHHYYETKNSFVGSEAGLPNVDNKEYGQILSEYMYAAEVNPTKISYNDAIKLAHKVLPDDIKEQRTKYDDTVKKTYIVYSSSQGNFVLGLCHESSTEDKNIVVGIDYMKEIIE
ncbi:hypothetical protein U732_118 [Clostridium argentinense CDC 2741]|uniref:Lipoprotein n=2 Tax=Clostridium argentinense TaxID=29341 RepID=A0A0C1U0A1_9CLOT|nr:hypothetical protein [Clostridium argentinense]ARC83149.1 hypothetical protein RSJ17_00420 [Clostridium argentinense]KIE44938.1 hypothetical protein U732_118 [Clostridium argentinense CDC 2741]NFF41610.1 hypothetical protein [Clostridium argentinense]NFP52310.1 hypothetical protein [Clostridium argentinense]NFP74677.1 hypothetical protein [Clostridium argentinense]